MLQLLLDTMLWMLHLLLDGSSWLHLLLEDSLLLLLDSTLLLEASLLWCLLLDWLHLLLEASLLWCPPSDWLHLLLWRLLLLETGIPEGRKLHSVSSERRHRLPSCEAHPLWYRVVRCGTVGAQRHGNLIWWRHHLLLSSDVAGVVWQQGRHSGGHAWQVVGMLRVGGAMSGRAGRHVVGVLREGGAMSGGAGYLRGVPCTVSLVMDSSASARAQLL